MTPVTKVARGAGGRQPRRGDDEGDGQAGGEGDERGRCAAGEPGRPRRGCRIMHEGTSWWARAWDAAPTRSGRRDTGAVTLGGVSRCGPWRWRESSGRASHTGGRAAAFSNDHGDSRRSREPFTT